MAKNIYRAVGYVIFALTIQLSNNIICSYSDCRWSLRVRGKSAQYTSVYRRFWHRDRATQG